MSVPRLNVDGRKSPSSTKVGSVTNPSLIARLPVKLLGKFLKTKARIGWGTGGSAPPLPKLRLSTPAHDFLRSATPDSSAPVQLSLRRLRAWTSSRAD